MYRKLILFAFLTSLSALLMGQSRNATYEAYIRQYGALAIDQMNRHRIPASITLSQALLESGAGQSYLARVANNHFGIKVSSGWTGPYVVRSDDTPNDRFRKYNSPHESYEDHSEFLKKQRYAKLFTYNMRDYKSWAHGLKACGYATSPTYAHSLINIIELYRLHEFDGGSIPSAYRGGALAAVTPIVIEGSQQLTHEAQLHPDFFASHPVADNNGNFYIRVLPGDNLKDIARATGVKRWRLRRYNELPRRHQPEPGSIIYLKKKHRRADRAFRHHPHTVTAGQSVYDIAQMYGMRVNTIYKLNHLPKGYSPKVGDQLRIR